jgi:hypothetical protein
VPSAFAHRTPAFRLRTTAANTAQTLQLQLLDAGGRNATWRFPLPPAPADFLTVLPSGAVAISHPHDLQRSEQPEDVGTLDLARIRQFKVQGDWQQGIVDLVIDALVLVEPDANMLAEREASAKADAEAAAQQAQQRAEAQEKLARERERKLRAYSYRGERTPQVTHVSLVAPEILSLTIEAQPTIPATMTKYAPQPGDEQKIETARDGSVRQATLLRQGKRIGRLRGKNLAWLFTDERLEDDPLLEFLTESPENYTIRSGDDPHFAQPVKPVAVYRKSVPRDVVLPGGQHPTLGGRSELAVDAAWLRAGSQHPRLVALCGRGRAGRESPPAVPARIGPDVPGLGRASIPPGGRGTVRAIYITAPT